MRLNNQLINFAVDSTETISFVADAGTFATSYSVEGSENSKAIKAITLAQLDANQAISRLRKEYEDKMISDTTYRMKVLAAADAYKEVARKYIYSAPMSTAAYFALFQQIDGLLFFDLYDRKDVKAYGAVATSYNHTYPESPRSKHLYNLTLQSMKVLRAQRPVDYSNVETKEISFLDIELPDVRGEVVKLSTVAPGKVVLINFTAYQTEWSPALNMALGELYTKYHDHVINSSPVRIQKCNIVLPVSTVKNDLLEILGPHTDHDITLQSSAPSQQLSCCIQQNSGIILFCPSQYQCILTVFHRFQNSPVNRQFHSGISLSCGIDTLSVSVIEIKLGIFPVIGHFPVKLQIYFAPGPGIFFIDIVYNFAVGIDIFHHRLKITKYLQYTGVDLDSHPSLYPPPCPVSARSP